MYLLVKNCEIFERKLSGKKNDKKPRFPLLGIDMRLFPSSSKSPTAFFLWTNWPKTNSKTFYSCACFLFKYKGFIEQEYPWFPLFLDNHLTSRFLILKKIEIPERQNCLQFFKPGDKFSRESIRQLTEHFGIFSRSSIISPIEDNS